MYTSPGDAHDVKRSIARMINSSLFVASLSTVCVGKGDGFWPQLPVFVFQEERLSHLVFPMAELIVYRTSYAPDEVIKQAEHTIGVRWTAVARSEHDVTETVERLVRATTDMLWVNNLDSQVQCGPIRVLTEDYSPLAPAADHPYVKSGLVMLAVPVWRS